MELTVDNIAALYFVDYFGLTLQAAGIAAGAFGMMNLFARALAARGRSRCFSGGELRRYHLIYA